MFLFFIFFLFCGCSPVTKHQATPLILDKDTISLIEDKKIIQGIGRVLFSQPLFDSFSKELYFIQADLFNENSFFVLHSHFTGFKKEDGIKVFFIRNKNSLIIQVSTLNYPFQHLYTDEKYFFQNQTLKVYTEVHNRSKNLISIKIWRTDINPTGYIKQSTSFLLRQNLLADSRELVFYSRGQGMLWGVELNKARLITIFRESLNQ